MKNKNKNEVARAVYQANKDGHQIKASIRLVRDGKFSSVTGIVEDLKVSMNGFPYVVFKCAGKKPYQNVRLNNILCVSKDDKLYKR